MKFHFLLICAVILVLAPRLSGQTSIISSGRDMITFMNSDLDYISNTRERYAEIEGSAYLDEDFYRGSVSFNGKKFTGLLLRHNPYEGYFEFQTDEGTKFFDPLITPIDTVWIEKDIFLLVQYNSGKQTKRDYMRLINQGKTRVFQFSQVRLLEAEEAQGYEDAKPARFKEPSETIYIKPGDQPAMEFRNKKSLGAIFPEYYEQLSEYAKVNKLKLKNPEEIISLCTYYDSLR